MDISKQYIEMCSSAKEIQSLRRDTICVKVGDWFVTPADTWVAVDADTKKRTTTYIEKVYNIDDVKDSTENCPFVLNPFRNQIWLPRQDQLQKIVIDGNDYEKLLWRFSKFVFKPDTENDFCIKAEPKRVLDNTFPSMEQLWLSFVMEEKYQKEWNGSKWV